MGKGKAHYIEVILDDEEDEDFGHLQKIEAETPGQAEEVQVTALQQMRR
jgi:vacuolar-type H+-ATPase subunit D/Vma8